MKLLSILIILFTSTHAFSKCKKGRESGNCLTFQASSLIGEVYSVIYIDEDLNLDQLCLNQYQLQKLKQSPEAKRVISIQTGCL